MTTQVPSVKLNNNKSIPIIGLGTYNEEDANVLVNAIKAAVKVGYRHFDCAYFYNNEEHIGRGIRESIQESNGQLKREDFFIVSKCWSSYHSKAKTRECLNKILEKFQLDYIDLFLIHWPMSFQEGGDPIPIGSDGKVILSDIHFIETYQAMEELVAEGKTKSIGLSNFNAKQVQEILNIAKIKPVCNQFEIHPMFQQYELTNFCQKNDIAVVAYAPFGNPSYCDRPELKPKGPEPLNHPVILKIAEKYKKTTSHVILRWLIQRNIVVIPKSVTPSRIASNFQLFDFELTQDDMNSIKEGFKDQQFRFNYYDSSDNSPFWPFRD